jgi:hypothetical protein
VTTLLQAIREVVRAEFCQNGNIELKETIEKGDACGVVKLRGGAQAVVLKLDGRPPPHCTQEGCQLRYSVNDRLFPLFKPDMAGLTALCDYLIFYLEKDVEKPRLFVFLCELKAGRPTGAKKQAENGKLMADYIIAMAKLHGRLTSIPACEARGLVFSPKCESIKILNPRQNKVSYAPRETRIEGMKFAYCHPGDYPLAYFCA